MNWVSKNWRGLLVLALGVTVLVATRTFLHVCGDVGDMLKTSSGNSVPMRCTWSEHAFEGMGGLVALLGLAMLILKNHAQGLSLAAGFTGVLMLATVQWLVPTCANAMMTCNMSFKPGALLLGGLITVVGLAGSIKFRSFESREATA